MDDDDDDYWADGRRQLGRSSSSSNDGSSRGMLIAEATLQAALRFLGAAADLILGSAPDPQEELRQFHLRQQQQQQQRRRRGRGDAAEEREQSWLLVRLIGTVWAGVRKLLGGLLGLGAEPERSSFWVLGLLLLVVCLLFSAYRSGFRLFRIVEQVELPTAPSASPSSPSSSQKRLLLPDGRTIAYREHGVSASKAKHSALLVQGIPKKPAEVVQGVNQSLVREFRVRLVSYDLPGFGASDANPRRSFKTSAQDLADIADVLGFGDRFWLLVYPGGGPLAWAAIRYIPNRLQGIVMLGPAEDDNPYTAGNLVDLEEEYVLPKEESLNFRTLFFLARHLPWLARLLVDTKAISNRVTRIHQGLYATVADTVREERVLWQQKEFIAFWEENLRQTQVQKKAPKGAQELASLEELLRLLNRRKSSSTSSSTSSSSWSSWSWATLNWLVPGFFKSKPLSSKRRDEPSSTPSTLSTPFPSPSLDLFKHKLFLVVLVLVLMAVVLRS